ncbi:endonuclease MutS2 [Paenibacillus senegalensis]|uniref:endonuclease MutS2 n=1 Tax=Paenibacillus senegalensis TaxID=1465766 RepID=UPI0002890575|nr:DNA mismatch repair protein MutS [Paenibacillus senegalensis]
MNEIALQRLEYDQIKQKLMEYAVSYKGKQQIEELQPMLAAKLIRGKLDETEEARALLELGASVPIPSLDGIQPFMDLLQTGYVFSESDFSHLYQFLRSCHQLMRYMEAKEVAAPRIGSYAASMYTMDSLRNEIERSIRNGRVADTASKELMKVRKKMTVVEERLKSRLDSLLGKHRTILQENVISMRGGRYVLPVKKEHRKLLKGTVLDESASGQTVYMEPAEIMNLQYELSGLKAEEAREELKVLTELSTLAAAYTHELKVNVETVGLYDFLFAKAKYALAIGGANVELNEEGRVELREARHPLVGRSMIPLNFSIGDGYSSLIITGPNTGGKTLALKTVGLLTVMVQSGLLVPVGEGSRFAVFTNLAVDIGDGQSIEHALSTFSAHIRNVIDILQMADRSTLVLIDEMASGTDPGEGVGLSIAILEELHRRSATVVATTHFTEIKNFAAAAPGFENARMEFDADTMRPLYRLTIGQAGQSYALLIALKLGIPPEIVKRSREITGSGYAAALPGEGETQENADCREGSDSSEGEKNRQKPQDENEEAPRAIENLAASATSGKTGSSGPSETSGTTPASSALALPPRKLQLGDRVYIPYLGRGGIVYETEDAKGSVGVMIQGQKMKINKKRVTLQIESQELYPDDYDMDIVFETKENRKKRNLMKRKHVEGLTIEKRPDE